jgi:hypothetical protein
MEQSTFLSIDEQGRSAVTVTPVWHCVQATTFLP